MGILTVHNLLNGPGEKVNAVLSVARGRIGTLRLAPAVTAALKIQRMLKNGPCRVASVRQNCLREVHDFAYEMAVKRLKEDGLLHEAKNLQDGEPYFIRINVDISEQSR